MSAGTTAERVQRIIVEHLGCDDDKAANMDSRLIDDLGADSLDIVELCMAFEEEFAIEIEDQEADWSTVRDCVELVDRKLAGKA